MSLPDYPPHVSPPMTPAPPAYAARPPRPGGSAAGLVALIGAGLLTFLYLVVKVIAAVFNADPTAFDIGSPLNSVAMVFGVLGILAIIPVVLVIVLGHLGVRPRADGSNAGRVVAAVGLGAGYVHLVAWLTRLIVAVILGAQYGDFSGFLTNLFWWA